jgi:hypothetical protein
MQQLADESDMDGCASVEESRWEEWGHDAAGVLGRPNTKRIQAALSLSSSSPSLVVSFLCDSLPFARLSSSDRPAGERSDVRASLLRHWVVVVVLIVVLVVRAVIFTAAPADCAQSAE